MHFVENLQQYNIIVNYVYILYVHTDRNIIIDYIHCWRTLGVLYITIVLCL